MRRVLLICLIVLVCPFAFGGTDTNVDETGIRFLEECQLLQKDGALTYAEATEAYHCMGYLVGVKDSLTMWNAFAVENKTQSEPPACIPHEVTVAELGRVVVKYMTDHPNRLHEYFGLLVFSAFIEAYPCRE